MDMRFAILLVVVGMLVHCVLGLVMRGVNDSSLFMIKQRMLVEWDTRLVHCLHRRTLMEASLPSLAGTSGLVFG